MQYSKIGSNHPRLQLEVHLELLKARYHHVQTIDPILSSIAINITDFLQAKILRVTIPAKSQMPVSVMSTYSIELTRDDSDSERRFHHVFGRRVIHTNDQSTVFLGTFQEVHVLLKYCYNAKFFRDFKQEVRVYKARLGGLQEEVVLFRYYLAEDELYGPYSAASAWVS